MTKISAWKIIGVWFALSLFIFTLENMWSLVAYAASFCIIYGGVIYRCRNRIRERIVGSRYDNFAVFILVAVSVSVAEELYVYVLGNRIAVPNIWLDIIIVPAEWAVWFSTWYLYLSSKYEYSEGQALLVAGLTGVFYEYIGNLYFIKDPVGFAISIPLAVVVYASLFILPMQFIHFRGQTNSWAKYPIGVALPFVLTIPVVMLLYIIL